VPYVVDGGFGIYGGNNPKKIAKTIGTLFTNETKLHEMSYKAKSLSHPEATNVIANEIAEVVLYQPPSLSSSSSTAINQKSK